MTEETKKKILDEMQNIEIFREEYLYKELCDVRSILSRLGQSIFNNLIESIENQYPSKRIESLIKQNEAVENSITKISEIIIELLEAQIKNKHIQGEIK